MYPSFINAFEALILAPFRFPSDPLLGYWLGCGVLAVVAVAIGEATSAALRRGNRRHLAEAGGDALTKSAHALAARRQGDRQAYEAANKLANDAFGRWFFHSAAISMSSLWPAFFAAAWLSQRFEHVVFPIPGTEATASFVMPLIVWVVVLRVGLAAARRLRSLRLSRRQPARLCP